MGKINPKLKQLKLEHENSSFSSDSSSKKCCTKEKFFSFCKKFITFLISRIGLMIVMMGYVLAGGLIFEAIESDYESKALQLSDQVLENMLRKIYKQIESNSTRVKDDSFYAFLRHEIRSFGDFFTNATLNGTLTGNIEPKWDFFGSVFYSVTLVSTIGYGHITCKTKLGKILTIIYSSIGIPLMMLFLANTGSSTATVFKFIYLKINSIKRGFRSRKLNRLNKAAIKKFEKTGFQDDYEVDDDNLEEEDEASDFYEYNNTNNSNNSNNNNNNNNSIIIEKNINEKTEIHDDSKTKKLKKKKIKELNKNRESNKYITVTIGIRDVDIPVEFIKNINNNIIINRNINNNNDSSFKNTARKQTFSATNINKNSNIITSISETRVKEAIKKIDTLIEQDLSIDQSEDDDDMVQEPDSISIRSKKKLSINDAELNSSENLNNLNNNYLITNIFSDSNTKNFKQQAQPQAIKKTNKSQSFNEKNKRNFSPSFELKPTNKRNSNEIILNNSNSNIINKKQISEASPKINRNKLRKQYSIANTNEFENDLSKLSNFNRKKATNRSLYAYDHHVLSYINSKNLKHPMVKFKTHQVPIYNAKQLNLIYKQYKQEHQDRAGVPMIYTLVIMKIYLICGMLIFSSYENWKKLDALYFCFVTLTTIGFGDMIPGSSLLNKNGNKNSLYISALYIFVGLMLIAMCINLVKTQIKLKIKSIARKIGLSNC